MPLEPKTSGVQPRFPGLLKVLKIAAVAAVPVGAGLVAATQRNSPIAQNFPDLQIDYSVKAPGLRLTAPASGVDIDYSPAGYIGNVPYKGAERFISVSSSEGSKLGLGVECNKYAPGKTPIVGPVNPFGALDPVKDKPEADRAMKRLTASMRRLGAAQDLAAAQVIMTQSIDPELKQVVKACGLKMTAQPVTPPKLNENIYQIKFLKSKFSP